MNSEQIRDLSHVTQLRQRARIIQMELTLNHSLEALWPYLSNTDMVNREMALPPVRILARPTGKGGSELTVESRELGLPIRYEELPYEWQAPDWLRVERLFTLGPVAYLCFETRLSPLTEGQTRASLSLAVVPKLPWLLLKPRVQQLLARMGQVYTRIDARIPRQSRQGVGAFLADAQRFAPRIDALKRQWAALAQDPRIAACLAEYVFTAPDRFVKKLRPFELAEFYRLDPMETLSFCLKATKAGYLNLSWDLICPGCQGAKVENLSLNRVNSEAHCDICDIDYSIGFDENFELTFHPAATVRRFDDAPFCAGAPSNTAHLILQRNLWPGQELDFELRLAPGKYRFRSPSIARALHFEVAEGGRDSLDLTMHEDFDARTDLRLAPNCRLTVANRRELFQVLSVENLAWRALRVSAALVSTLQEFRDSFSSEVLRPGLQLAIANLTVMFTDLKDSTLMYELTGDAYAFNLVQEHFERMQAAIREHHGAIVKTIGDAVMAVFQEPRDAVRCALEIQHSFRAWNHQWHQEDPERRVIVKLGLHRGPSIALTLNERLDYFGTTINRAARIQSQSLGEDIVLSAEMLADAEVGKLLRPFEIQPFETNLKGLSGTQLLHRIDLRAQATQAAELKVSEAK